MYKFKKNYYLKIIIGLAIIILITATYVTRQLTRPASLNNITTPFEISAGQSVKQISYNLKQQNLINSRWWFEAWVRLTKTDKKFITGAYQLPSNSNIIKLVKLLTNKLLSDNEIVIQLPEGWTITQIDNYLAQNKIFTSKNFKTFTENTKTFGYLSERYKILADKPANASLEGYLFPDTYRIFKKSTVAEVVTRMLTNFEHKFVLAWREIIKQRGYNIHQIVTLASIVEKEVNTDTDRAMVADIFWRRLKASRGLEADSTINYLTGKNLPSVTYDDLKIDSPYNTYKYRGLPPGPISNPGLASLKAVVYPQSNDYWYFLTTPDGQVIYSKSYNEHLIAKRKYLK